MASTMMTRMTSNDSEQMSPTSPVPSQSFDNKRFRAPSRQSLRSLAQSSFLAAVSSDPPREDDFFEGSEADEQDNSWFSGFGRRSHNSDELPSAQNLRELSRMFVYDADGQAVPFKEIYTGIDGGGMVFGEKTMVILIPNFFSEACQSYTSLLASSLPNPLPSRDSQIPSTSITLISCGNPALIRPYIYRTGCPFPVYSDPSLKIFKALGCKRWAGLHRSKNRSSTNLSTMKLALNTFGRMAKASMTNAYDPESPTSPTSPTSSSYSTNTSRRPSHATTCTVSSMATTNTAYTSGSETGDQDLDFNQAFQKPRKLRRKISLDGLRGGPLLQVGGEFLFEDGNLVWCHRMQGIRDQVEMNVIKRVLDLPLYEEEDEDYCRKRSSETMCPKSAPAPTPRSEEKKAIEGMFEANPFAPKPRPNAPARVKSDPESRRQSKRWSLASVTEVAVQRREQETGYKSTSTSQLNNVDTTTTLEHFFSMKSSSMIVHSVTAGNQGRE